MPTAPPGIAVGEASRVLQLMDRELREVPEVERVFGKIGRAETPTDPAPLSMVETVVQLAPRERWRPGLTWDALVDGARREAALPGHAEPVVDADPDAHGDARDRRAQPARREGLRRRRWRRSSRRRSRSRAALADVPGTRSAFAERATGAFYLDVAHRPRARGALRRVGRGRERRRSRRRSAARTSRRRSRAASATRSTCATRSAFRDDPEAIGRTLVPTATGALVPLRELAELALHARARTWCAARRASSSGWSRSTSPAARSSTTSSEARRVVAERVTLPPARASPGSASSSTSSARRRGSRCVLPLTLALVALLLYLNTRSGVETAMVHARGAVLAGRRGLAALRARLQPVGRGLGRDHRARRARRADRRGDAALPLARARASAQPPAACATRRISRTRSSRARRGASARS